MLGLAVAGEHTTLTEGEKLSYIQTLTDANAGRVPVIISVTAQDPNESLALSRTATQAGAAGVCVQIPENLNRQGMHEFLRDIANAGPDILMVQDLDWDGGGLSLDDITYLFDKVDRFSWLKIETQQAGPKYSAVLRATDGKLNVCGGWAVTQLMDALARGVHAFIPTGMERVYVSIQRLYETGEVTAARALFERVLPILNFSNQNIGISIRFFKELRKAEGLFETDQCRLPQAQFDDIQALEARHARNAAMALIRQASEAAAMRQDG